MKNILNELLIAKKNIKRSIYLSNFLAICIVFILKLWSYTFRIRWLGDLDHISSTKKGGCIYAFWHGDIYPLLIPFSNTSSYVLVSNSDDGTFLSNILKKIGYNVVRGSSHKNGQKALSELENILLSKKKSVAIAVDGPRGPRLKVKSGVIKLSQNTLVPILCINIVTKGFRLKSWDNFVIPFPFSKVYIKRQIANVDNNQTMLATHCNISIKKQYIEKLLLDVKIDASKSRKGSLLSLDKKKPSTENNIKIYFFLLNFFSFIAIPLLFIIIFRSKHRALLLKGRTAFFIEKRTKTNSNIWVHSASAGEANIAINVKKIIEKYLGYENIVFTTNSINGYNTFQNKRESAFFAPYDLPLFVKIFYKKIRPKVIILIETEIWPVMLYYARKYNIKVIILNAKMSEKSFYLYDKFSFLFFPLLEKAVVLARKEEDSLFYKLLGVQNVSVIGDSKIYLQLTDSTDSIHNKKELSGTGFELEKWMVLRPTIILASFHEEENTFFLSVCKKFSEELLVKENFNLLIAPRYPVVQLKFFKKYLNLELLSSIKSNDFFEKKDNNIVFMDSVGVLSSYYNYSKIVIMGGTFSPIGGHNLIEPAIAGNFCFYGKFVYNIKEQVEALESFSLGESINASADLLSESVLLLINNEDFHNKIEENAQLFKQYLLSKSKQHIDNICTVISSCYSS